MKANLKDILESIPDFEDFMKLAAEIGELSFKKMKIENEIKARESEIARTVFTDNKYWLNGKMPSMSLIESVYTHGGLEGELHEKRLEFADVSAMLDKRKIQLSIYRDMLEVFRTVSANERSVAT